MTDHVTTDDPAPDDPATEPETRTASIPRRRALGVAALGLLAAACRQSGEQEATGLRPTPASSPSGGGDPGVGAATDASGAAPLRVTLDGSGEPAALPVPTPTATGPELDQVLLPVADQADATIPTQGGAGGGSPDDPMVVVVDPDPPADPPTTGPPSNDPMDGGEVMEDEQPGSDTGGGSDQTGGGSDTGGDGGVARPTDDPTNPTDQPPVTTGASVALVASRVTFGASPSLMAEIRRRSAGGYIADQLARTGPDPQAESLLDGYGLMNRGASKAAYDAASRQGNKLQLQLTHATVLRAVYSRHQLYEMMCQLWADHFNVELFGDGRTRHLVADHQENVIRPNAMGSFRDLLVATAHSPAMLTYLDNDGSNANANQGLNENYGRELLELHTLGIDENGNHVYTEADVRAAAMAMSGWSIVTDRKAGDYSSFTFRGDHHHRGDISLLNGAWTRGSTTGKATGDSLLQFLVTHPSTARHIARKLCLRFVSDDPPASLIDSTARVYLANDTRIVPTLRHVLTSDAFASSAGQKLRRPIEYVAAALRATGAEMASGPDSGAARAIRSALQTMDNQPWTWSQPDGFPERANHWLTTHGLTQRWQMGARVARNRVNGIRTNVDSLRSAAGGSTAQELAGGLAVQLGLGTRPAAELAAVATGAGLDPAEPAGTADEREVADMVSLLLAHPIFQTR